MATIASSLVLAKIKSSFVNHMSDLVTCFEQQGYMAASDKSIEIAKYFGFINKLANPQYAFAIIGMNTNGNYSYVEDALKDLKTGYNPKTGNCCFENSMRSHLIIPTLLSIYDVIAESYVIITVDETHHSMVVAKNTGDLRPLYLEYANEYMDRLGYDQNIENDKEKQFIYHPNFDKEESYLDHLLTNKKET